MVHCIDYDQFAGFPATAFILHRQPMLLLDRLVEVGSEYAVCEWQVTESTGFATPGEGVPTYVGIECMAQCIAVHAGVRARIQGYAPPVGLLLGTRSFRTHTEFLAPGTTCQIRCHELLRDGQGMASYDCRLSVDGNTIVECRLAVFEKQRGLKLNGDSA